MKFLAFDTSTQAFSVALFVNDEVVSHHEIAPRLHAKKLLPTTKLLLSEADLQLNDLNGIVFGQGPGAFTGVRIAAAAAQGLALGADIGVLPLSSLALTAQGYLNQHSESLALTAFDARMDEIYIGLYQNDNGVAAAIQSDYLCKVADIKSFDTNETTAVTLVSDGCQTYRSELIDLFSNKCNLQVDNTELQRLPNAKDALPLVKNKLAQQDWLSAERAAPVYLRNNVAIAVDKSL